MIKIKLLLISLIVYCGGCIPGSQRPIDADTYNETIRVACIGDSITFGANIEDRENNHYPLQLGRMLGKKWETRNFGINGATLLKKGDNPYWKHKAYQDALDYNPHVVIIKLGTNDTKPQNWKYSDEYADDYKEMIRSFAALEARPRIWICLPVPAYPERWGISDEVIREGVIPMVTRIASESGVGLIDLYTPLKDKPELFPDLIHPNAVGAGVMAREIYKAITGKELMSIFEGTKSQWNGYDRYDFEYDGRNCIIVAPAIAARGNPWLWRARFFGHEPQTDLALLSKGFFITYMDVSDMYGSPTAVKHWDNFYNYLTKKHAFNPKAALEGFSRGGLIIYNWAAANPDKVACIYADAPVCDIRSWPGGGNDGSRRSQADWKKCLAAYNMTESQAVTFSDGPLDNLEPLAGAGIPLLHVCGLADKVVPMIENTDMLQSRYEALGGSIRVIRKAGVGHHPHSLEIPTPIVNFILQHTIGENDYIIPRRGLKRSHNIFANKKQGRVAFIGGSITEMNGYRPMVCRQLEQMFPETIFEFIDAGISSTCSTTGAFRIDKDVFRKGKTDLLFIEFAVNDNQDAHHTETECIRAMEGIVKQGLKHNPYIDIIFIYTANESHIELYQRGDIPMEIASHEKVAGHYHLPSINFAADVAQRMRAMEFDWKKFGGVHPAEFGNKIYAEDIASLFKASYSLKPDSQLTPHQVPSPIDAFSYSSGRFVNINTAKLQGDWKIEKPDWSKIKGSCRQRFKNIPLLVCSKTEDICTVEFKGSAIGAYVLAGPDAGIIEYSINGNDFKQIDLYHKYSLNLHYPRTVMFETQLPKNKYTLTVRLSNNSNPQSTGNSARIIAFTAN